MSTITRRWKKWMAVGCSHGFLADKAALKAALRFRADYKPTTAVHLGDFWDATALRSGASGTKDSAASIDADLQCGLTFMEQLEANWIFMGNHDDRVEKFQDHPDAIKAYAARKIVQDLSSTVKRLKAKLIPYDIATGWRKLGNYNLGHGYMFNEAAIRDHAESFGNCIIAHLHRTGEERGRRLGGVTGYCIGSLADIPSMAYAKIRRSTLKWNLGFAFGEYCDNATTVNLMRRTDDGHWRLP